MRTISFDALVTVTAAIALGAVLCRAPFQNDTWWHLRIGEDLVDHGIWPFHDHFTFTVNGAAFEHHEWLASTTFYVLDALVGHAGPTALIALTALVAFAVVWQRMPGPAIRKVLLLGATAPVTAAAVSVRPHVFSMLFVVVVVELLRRERFALLPLVFLVWANLHGAVALGGVIAVAALVLALRDRTRWLRLLPVVVMSGAGAMATPLGARLISSVLALSGEVTIQEWRPSWEVMPGGAILAVVALAWIVAMVTSPSKQAWEWEVDLAAGLVLLPPAVRYNRVIPLFVVVALAPIAMALARRWPARERPDPPRVAHTAIAGVAAVAAITFVVVGWARPDDALGWEPVSDDAIAALRGCEGNLYNRYDDGGYLIWFAPERRVFIDSRLSPFPSSFVDDHTRDESTGDYQATFERWDIRCAFLPPSSPTAAALIRDRWIVSHQDSRWVVLAAPR